VTTVPPHRVGERGCREMVGGAWTDELESIDDAGDLEEPLQLMAPLDEHETAVRVGELGVSVHDHSQTARLNSGERSWRSGS